MTKQTEKLKEMVLLKLVNGMSPEKAKDLCIAAGAAKSTATRIVKDARKKISIAADYVRDEQIGQAMLRLTEIYKLSVEPGADQDIKTALQTQKEINKLLSLYPSKKATESESPGDAEGAQDKLRLIESHLFPLELIGPEYPVEEHARQAANFIRSHRQKADR